METKHEILVSKPPLNEITRPASFSQSMAGLTNGQVAILRLLQQAVKEGKIITKNDIVLCYFNHGARRSGRNEIIKYNCVRKPDGSGWHHVQVEVGVDDWRIQRDGVNWFKNNLGACIIKGRLLAIPVIDIQ